MAPEFKTILVDMQPPVCTVTLNRPEVANAMNFLMVTEILDLATELVEENVRVLLIKGAGKHFCAGGDIRDIQEAKGEKHQLARMNRAFGEMLMRLESLPITILVQVHGAAMGGGFGLACISDYTIALDNAKFALPETQLGVIPAQIAPFVCKRIGAPQTQALALFGQRIKAPEAFRIGLVHEVAESEHALQERTRELLNSAVKAAPQASAKTKQLIHAMAQACESNQMSQLLDQAAIDFSEAAVTEGREGALAFSEKRQPAWVTEIPSGKE